MADNAASQAPTPKSKSVSPRRGETGAEKENPIAVVCRVRPRNHREEREGEAVAMDCDANGASLNLKTKAETVHFDFDAVVDMNGSQEEMYAVAARPIVEDFLEGYNGTVLAYGQTASGKTYTVEGILDDPEKQGLIPRMADAILAYKSSCPEHITCTLEVQFLEIYNEKIRDLLDMAGDNLKIRESFAGSIYVDGATSASVSSKAEILELLLLGASARAKAETLMNESSSRSHSLFIMSLHQRNSEEGSTKQSKLYTVDLAGSEMLRKTGAEGATLNEAKFINKSLSALNKVISLLSEGKTHHIPYRDSKLTRLLSEAIGGNCRTGLLVCCSPSQEQAAESLSTLRFGRSAKKIKNQAKINHTANLQEMNDLIVEMRRRVAELEMAVQAKDYEIEILKKTNQGGDEAVMRMVEIEEENKNLKSRIAAMESEHQEEMRDLEGEVEILHAALDLESFMGSVHDPDEDQGPLTRQGSKVRFAGHESGSADHVPIDEHADNGGIEWTDDDSISLSGDSDSDHSDPGEPPELPLSHVPMKKPASPPKAALAHAGPAKPAPKSHAHKKK